MVVESTTKVRCGDASDSGYVYDSRDRTYWPSTGATVR